MVSAVRRGERRIGGIAAYSLVYRVGGGRAGVLRRVDSAVFRVRRRLGGQGLASGDVKAKASWLKLLKNGCKAIGRRSCHLCWCWCADVLERGVVLLAFLCNAGLGL